MREFWINPLLAAIRDILSGFLFLFTIYNSTHRENESYIPTSPPSDDEDEILAMLGPVICLIPEKEKSFNSSKVQHSNWRTSYRCYVLLAIYMVVVLAHPLRDDEIFLKKVWKLGQADALKPDPESQNVQCPESVGRILKKKIKETLSILHNGSLVASLSIPIYIGSLTLAEVFQLQQWVQYQYKNSEKETTATQLGSQLVIFSVWPMGFALIKVVTGKKSQFIKLILSCLIETFPWSN